MRDLFYAWKEGHITLAGFGLYVISWVWVGGYSHYDYVVWCLEKWLTGKALLSRNRLSAITFSFFCIVVWLSDITLNLYYLHRRRRRNLLMSKILSLHKPFRV